MELAPVYQGLERKQMLEFLRRVCFVEKEALMEELCLPGGEPCGSIVPWVEAIRVDLRSRICQKDDSESREAKAMSLFRDAEELCSSVKPSLDALCAARSRHLESRAEGVLWNVLSQYLKRKMDEQEGAGRGRGTHVVKVRRRLEQLVRELKARKEKAGARYGSRAELAADLVFEIKQRGSSNLPTTTKTVLKYLYEIEDGTPDGEGTIPIDNREVFRRIALPETLILIEQCLDRLSEELYQAVAGELGLANDPVFLNDESCKQYYGVGREALRKRRYRQAVRQRCCDLRPKREKVP